MIYKIRYWLACRLYSLSKFIDPPMQSPESLLDHIQSLHDKALIETNADSSEWARVFLDNMRREDMITHLCEFDLTEDEMEDYMTRYNL